MVVATALRVRQHVVRVLKARHVRHARKVMAIAPNAARAPRVQRVVAIRLSVVRVQRVVVIRLSVVRVRQVVAMRRAARRLLSVRTTAASAQASQVAVRVASQLIVQRASPPVLRPSVAVGQRPKGSGLALAAHRASRSNKNGLPWEPIFLPAI